MVGQFIEQHGTNKNLHGQVAAQTEARSADLKEAGTAGLEHAHLTPRLNAEFRHARNPARFAGDLGDLGRVARTQKLKRQEKIDVHRRKLGR